MADDRPLIEWHVHDGNWTAVCSRGRCAAVNHMQDSRAGERYWRVDLAGPGLTLPQRWATADEAKEAVEDLLGDELAGWQDPL